MKTAKSFQKTIIWTLIFLLAIPMPAFSQDSRPESKKFPQAQLDQMLAPIALYPDVLLGQILMASTYPLEVVAADRWVRNNKDLQSDDLTEAAAKQPWDVSVKALVPFPSVLSMMSEKLDWMQNVGDAFLAQESDVMDTVQELRKKAQAAGNLGTTDQQQVTVDNDVVYIAPRNPDVVYVPVYDPGWIYGPWWWPDYPPYVVYPYSAGFVLAPGFIWFGAGCFVGAFWGRAWGYWDWHHHRILVNVNRSVNINSRNINISSMKTTAWVHDPVHRRGVAYRDPVSRERFGAINRQAVENRRIYRGFERAPGVAPRSPTGRTGTPEIGSTQPLSRPEVRISPSRSALQAGGRPAVRSGSEAGGRPNVFTGIGQGREVRVHSLRGSSAISGGRVGESQIRGAGNQGERSGGARPAASGSGGTRGRQH